MSLPQLGLHMSLVTTTVLYDIARYIVPSSPRRNGTYQMIPFSPRFTYTSVHTSHLQKLQLCQEVTSSKPLSARKKPSNIVCRDNLCLYNMQHHSTNIVLICRRQWFSTGGKMNTAREGGSTVQIGSYIVTLGKSTLPFFYILN